MTHTVPGTARHDSAVVGLLGEKLGMSQVFDTDGTVVPVTVVRAGPCVVTQVRTPERDGYSAVQLAYGAVDPRRVTRPVAGHFAAAGVPPRRHVVEVRTADAASYAPGQEVTAEALPVGSRVDVSATSKGKGFAGGMKRHGFSGVGASHGAHRNHRKPGSVGACATPSRVFKGTRMAGRMGAERVTTLNLLVVDAKAEDGLVLLRGAVPGPRGGLVLLRSAVQGGAGGSGAGS